MSGGEPSSIKRCFFVCREVAGSEPAAEEAGIRQHSSSGVQSYQGPFFLSLQGVSVIYQALYRKWRPQTFDDVIGQEHITDSLKNQVRTGHLSHAYMFIGTRGTGKTSCARILAKAVNCEHPVNGNPCLKCAACRAIAEGGIMDIVELDAASNNGVDNVRALREEAVFSPASLKKRVYIVDEVHMLSNSAFNALLKILEEPPEHLLFILATTELQKVPATILSRCQRHSFRRINAAMLSEYLMNVAGKEGISLRPDASGLIASLAEGGVRDALSMLDQCSAYGNIDLDTVYAAVGLAGNRRITELFERICAHDAEGAISLFQSLWMEGKDPVTLLRELSGLVRDVLLLKVAPHNAGEMIYGGYDADHLRQYAAQYSAFQLSGTLETLQSALGNMRERLSPKMTAELCLISLCTELGGDSLSGLSARVSRLEEVLSSGTLSATAAAGASPVPEADKKSASASRTEESSASSHRITDPERSAPEASSKHRPEEKPVVQIPASPKLPECSVPASAGDITREEFWQKVCEAVKPSIPVEIRSLYSTIARGRAEGDSFILEVQPGFYYGRFNRPEILTAFSQAASALSGRSLTAILREWLPDPVDPSKPLRDLEELRKFPEVRFK